MRIDSHGYSQAILDKIVNAGGSCKSFQHASQQLQKLAELSISHMQVARLTHQVGREFVAARNRQAEQHRYRKLAVDPNQTRVCLACVESDGARIMTRAAHQSRGVHDKQWKEPKVAVLWRMTGETFDNDPHPELPRCFQDRERVQKLVREIHGGGQKQEKSGRETAVSSQNSPVTDNQADHGITLEEITASAGTTTAEGSQPGRNCWHPQRTFRTCVASLRDIHGFGPLVSAEAQRRGFFEARRKVFLGDGQESNWTLQRLHFPDFIPITDFMHAVAYAFAPAQVIHPDRSWECFLSYATTIWQGRVGEVIDDLKSWLERSPLPEGVPLKNISDQDPRKIVHESLTYFQNNRDRMNYPEYRRLGMPVTSSLVESLIKEVNWRVKGTEKFWNRSDEPPTSRRTGLKTRGHDNEPSDMSGESILQIRASLLCHDNRLEEFINQRPGSPFVRGEAPKARSQGKSGRKSQRGQRRCPKAASAESPSPLVGASCAGASSEGTS